MISQLFLNLKKINKNINTKTSKHTNSFRWIWTPSPNSLLQNTKAKPWIHSFIVATTSEFRHLPGRLNRKGKNILTQQWIPSEKQGKNKNVIKTQKDCTEIPMLFSESGKEVQIFLTKERNKKGAESWKAEAFPQSRNFINLHYLKVTDSTHKTTAGLHINRATRSKFWYLQLTLISYGVICTWISIWVTPQNRGWGSCLSYSGSPHSRGSFQTASVKLLLWPMPKAVLISTMNMEPVFIGKVSDLSVSMSDVKMESGCEISRYPSPGDWLKHFRDAPALPGAVSLGTLSLGGDAMLNS